MNAWGAFDLVAGVVVLVFVVYGFAKGIVRLTVGFAGVAAGWVLAVRYDEPVARWIGASAPPSAGPDLMRLAAAAAIFLAVALAAGLLAWLVGRALAAARLGFLDRMAGAALGFLMAILFVCAVTIPLVAHWPPDGSSPAERSFVAPYAIAGGEYLQVIAPDPMRKRFGDRAEALLARPAKGR